METTDASASSRPRDKGRATLWESTLLGGHKGRDRHFLVECREEAQLRFPFKVHAAAGHPVEPPADGNQDRLRLQASRGEHLPDHPTPGDAHEQLAVGQRLEL